MPLASISKPTTDPQPTTTPAANPAPTNPILPSDLLKPLSQARQKLLSHLRLLALLHHRNKNQHRRSPWFRHFGNFRKEIVRFCAELGIEVVGGLDEGGRELDSLGGGGAGTRKGNGAKVKERRANALVIGSRRSGAEAARRASSRLRYWIDGCLVQKWYIAFTTLATTPSFCPLSLTLLALLAHVLSLTGATAELTARADAEEESQRRAEEAEMHVVLGKFAEEDAPGLFEGKVGREKADVGPGLGGVAKDLDMDVGVVIARGDVGVTGRVGDSEASSVSRRAGKLKVEARKKRRVPKNAIDALFQGL